MSIQSQIDRINDAKSSLKSAISSKGVSVPENANIEDLPALVRSIPQEGGGGGGSGIIDVTELPTENIDENAVYRVTESYMAKPTVLWIAVPEETGEISANVLFVNGLSPSMNIYVVDELPADMKPTDMEELTEVNAYITRTDGIAYVFSPAYGMTVSVGALGFGDTAFDKGWTDDINTVTEIGVYATPEKHGQFKKMFIREGGQWVEITGQIEQISISTPEIVVMSLRGTYTRGGDIVVEKNGTIIDIDDVITSDNCYHTVQIATPDTSALISGRLEILDENYFVDIDGGYVNRIKPYAFYTSNIRSAVIPSSVSEISTFAFQYCNELTSVTFKRSDTNTYISDNTFDGCHNLTTINVPWSEGEVAYAPWGATNATINYNYTEG